MRERLVLGQQGYFRRTRLSGSEPWTAGAPASASSGCSAPPPSPGSACIRQHCLLLSRHCGSPGCAAAKAWGRGAGRPAVASATVPQAGGASLMAWLYLWAPRVVETPAPQLQHPLLAELGAACNTCTYTAPATGPRTTLLPSSLSLHRHGGGIGRGLLKTCVFAKWYCSRAWLSPPLLPGASPRSTRP